MATPGADPDAGLIERARGGDEVAFATLYRRYADFVWSRLTRLVGPEPEREDLVQQVFIEVHRAIPSFRAEARFKTFLYSIVTHVASEHLVRHRRRPRVVALDEITSATDPRPSPEQEAARRGQIELTWSLLDRLKPEKRLAFLLRVVEGLSLEEIGAIVGARPPAVWARVQAAERELAALLRKRDGRRP